MISRTLVVLEGDQAGQELLEESLRVLAPEVTRVPIGFVRYDGVKTTDLGAHATTTEFTGDVIRRVEAKLEVWSAPG